MDSKGTGDRPEGRPGHGTLVLIGEMADSLAAVVTKAGDLAGEAVHRHSDVDGALGWIEQQAKVPTAIALWMDQEGAARRAIAIRQNFNLAAVPILGLVRKVGDLAFEEAFASGIDDVTAVDDRGLGRRLRFLEELVPGSVARREETGIVADPDRDTRLLIGRVFRDAGYTVGFAVDAEETVRQSLEPKTIAVIVSSEMSAERELLALSARDAGSHAAWIINTPPKEMPAAWKRVGPAVRGGAKITVHDAFSAPATLLFVANELVNKPGKDVRKSERVLYGTSVSFRQAGREVCDVGYMYNISEGGMYMRTLAPPERWEELWIEFTPPRSDRRVHLEGTTVWARKFGPSSIASVPPGFGVQITGGSKGDVERYEKSYQTFVAERVSERDSHMP